jgi:hypothetical protein
MRNNLSKKLIGSVLFLGCFGMYSFTSTDNVNNAELGMVAAEGPGPTVTCPEGDLFTCYYIQGGTVWKGSGKTTIVYN